MTSSTSRSIPAMASCAIGANRADPVAVQLRTVGVKWAIPRTIHGVRLAITSTARSERRIAVRRSGVGIDTNSASAEPARAPWRSTAKSCQVPGTPHNSTLPRSSKPVPDPTTRSHTVRETRISPAPGLAEDPRRDVYCDPPDVGVQQFALAGVDASADLDAQCLGVSAQSLGAADGLRGAVERGEVTVAGALDHRAAESFRKFGGDLPKSVQHPSRRLASCQSDPPHMPAWWEQAPLLCSTWVSVPSQHLPLALFGFASGSSTQSPLLARYVPGGQSS